MRKNHKKIIFQYSDFSPWLSRNLKQRHFFGKLKKLFHTSLHTWQWQWICVHKLANNIGCDLTGSALPCSYQTGPTSGSEHVYRNFQGLHVIFQLFAQMLVLGSIVDQNDFFKQRFWRPDSNTHQWKLKVIKINSLSHYLKIMECIVLRRVVQASLWNTITTLVVGSRSWYCLLLHLQLQWQFGYTFKM